MALQLSKANLARQAQRIQAMAARVKNAAAKADVAIESTVRSLEVTASAFALGTFNGYKGAPTNLMGMPLELILGTAGHIAAHMGVGGKMKSHLHSFADGALATWSSTVGRGVGMQMRAKGAGSPASTQGTSLPDGEF